MQKLRIICTPKNFVSSAHQPKFLRINTTIFCFYLAYNTYIFYETWLFMYEMRTSLQLATRPKPTHPVQEGFDFLILLNIILFIRYTEETLL